jgi:hypothetical protein
MRQLMEKTDLSSFWYIMKNGKAQWTPVLHMTKVPLSSPSGQNQNTAASSGLTLKTKIVWTLVFKMIVVLSLFFIFKNHKQIVSSQDVAQKLLTREVADDIEEP